MDGGNVFPSQYVPQEGTEEEAGVLIGERAAAAEKVGKTKGRAVFILILVFIFITAVLQGRGDGDLVPQDLLRQSGGTS